MRIIALLIIITHTYTATNHHLSYHCVAEIWPSDIYNISIKVDIDNLNIINFNNNKNITHLVENEYIDDILYYETIPKIYKFYKRNTYDNEENQYKNKLYTDVVNDIKQKLKLLMSIYNDSTYTTPHVYKSFYECTVNSNGDLIIGNDTFTYDDIPYGNLSVNESYFWFMFNNELTIVKIQNSTNNLYRCVNYLNSFVKKESYIFEPKSPSVELIYSETNNDHILYCLSSGFFPYDINIQWRNNGKNITSDKVILQNDTSFIGSSIIHVPFTDGGNYTCTIHHQSLKEDIVVYRVIDKKYNVIIAESTDMLLYIIYLSIFVGIAFVILIISYISYKRYRVYKYLKS
ncbi:MHC class I protein [Yokapox virus]|uniref:MHC class I protein n=1 Tax=Yokapox virus TaxID=1076255 RepID=G3EI65_9POXV|nr:MHC class I protein [Yokapox virus]AEN03762.1 MHC class I protein [Yokapox virus]